MKKEKKKKDGRELGPLTIAALVKAVLGVAVVGIDDNFGALVLEADGGVDDEALGAADAQVVEGQCCFK